MQKLRLLYQSEALAVLPVCIDLLEKISRLTADKKLNIITADNIIFLPLQNVRETLLRKQLVSKPCPQLGNNSDFFV